MGPEIEQTKRNLSEDLQITISYLFKQGYVAPICHSHYDGEGSCKVFVLRFELNHRLIKVNVTDGQQEKNAIMDVSKLNKNVTVKDTSTYSYSYRCIRVIPPIVVPNY